MEAGCFPAGNAGAATGAAGAANAGTKVIRAPGLKRGKLEEAITERIKLESVLGVTVSSNAALDCDPNAELVAYPAGCTVVLYNTRKNRQHHIVSPSRKTITCVAFSSDGRYLATGECGHAPCVRVWDLQDPSSGGSGGVQVAEFPGHKYGVNCVAFSVSSKYLVSVGSQHDMIVNVWDWKANLKLASNKVSSKVKAVSFAENGSYFVTVGNRHVKFWYLEYSRSAKYKEPVPLMGRSAILGEQRNNDFCDVSCGRGDAADTTYAITKSGLLCEFNNRRLLKQWVELRTTSANCMSVGAQFIFIGCADGLVRCFSPLTLMYVTTLPRPHYLGVDISLGMNITHMFNVPPNARYPDAVALTYDDRNHKLSCVYNDHSFYVWDVRDIMRIGKSNSALYHSACIWGVEMLPANETTTQNGSLPMPVGSFLTCSSDDTVRVWNLNQNAVQSSENDTVYKGNIYSNELLKVMYVDPDMTYLKDVDLTATNDKEKPVSYDGKNGVRCIRISPCGQHIAHGDRAGNVRVSCARTARPIVLLEAHDAEVLCLEYSPITTSGPRFLASASRDRLIHLFNVDEGYKFVQTLDDHSSSITSVRFLITNNTLQMVSCGADKTILFRELVVLPDGSASFSRAHVVSGKSTLYDMEVEGTASGARSVLAACQDRCVRVYSAQHAKHTKTFRASTADDGSLIKVALDSSGIYVATSCTDKTLCVYDYYSGECMATMYGHSELVTGLRFTLDCQYLISASGDGCVFVWRVPHDMVVTMRARLAQQAIRQGRKPPIPTGITGVDSEEGDFPMGSPPRRHGNAVYEDEIAKQNAALVEMPDYRLSIGRLPSWAQKSLDVLPASGSDSVISTSTNPASVSDDAPLVPPRGKWAKRLQNPAVGAADYSGLAERRLDSDGSKDSSLDSGTDTRLYADRLRETSSQSNKQRTRPERPKSLNLLFYGHPDGLKGILEEERNAFTPGVKKHNYFSFLQSPLHNKNVGRSVKLSGMIDTRLRHHTDDSSLGSFKFEDLESTEHDGDVEDISDGERTSSSDHTHRTMYYPGNNDDSTPGEFTVNAMDVEELRQSQRRIKKAKAVIGGIGSDGAMSPIPKARPLMNLPIISVSGTSVSGSGQDSEEDDDEVSTPSGDNADKNPLSGSCESIDTLGMRGKFLKSAYESLSGAEIDSGHGNTSISAQHHYNITSSVRINSSKQTPATFKIPSRDGAPIAAPRNQSHVAPSKGRDDDTSRKREELNRRIEETRRQLESVGYRSGLKSSQSTMDLSYTPEKDHNPRTSASSRQRPVSMAIQTNNRIYGPGGYFGNHSAVPLISENPSINLDSLNCNDGFYDSLISDLSQKNSDEMRKRNPYDIPANRYYLQSYSSDSRNSNYERNSMISRYANDNLTKSTTFDCKNSNQPIKKSFPYPSDSLNYDITKLGSRVFDRLFSNHTPNTIRSAVENLDRRNLNLNFGTEVKPKKTVKPNNRSIFKNYKSCPVSPVSEECKWGDLVMEKREIFEGIARDSSNSVKRHSLNLNVNLDGKFIRDNGKSLVDAIKNDTEKMIAEITKKYGDLDESDNSFKRRNKIEDVPSAGAVDDGNFSSDSLEDCSLSQETKLKSKHYTKKVCKKHNKNSTLPRRCISDYEIYGYMNEKNANTACDTYNKIAELDMNHRYEEQKSSTLPRNMPSDQYSFCDNANYQFSQPSINRCYSSLTKRCITMSNESILSDENSNCSSASNEIFVKHGDQSGFAPAKITDTCYRNNTLSRDVSYENVNDASYLDKQRHSSASFFLNQRKFTRNGGGSQESVLSDDLFPESENQMLSKTNCNSLESILSDDSEYTKSAPLEMLFEGYRKRAAHTVDPSSGIQMPKNSHSCYEFDNTSKSYGSSPNNTSYIAGHMCNTYYNQYSTSPQEYTNITTTHITKPKSTTYGFDIVPLKEEETIHKTVTRSQSLQDQPMKSPLKKAIAYYIDGNALKDIKADSFSARRIDEIPRSKEKQAEYSAKEKKSLTMNCPNKFKYMSNIEGYDKPVITKSKSYSFEVVLEPPTMSKPTYNPKKITSHVKKNLEKFEEQIRKNTQTKQEKNNINKERNKIDGKLVKLDNVTKSLERNTVIKASNSKLISDFVAHKPPKPVKRTSSVKLMSRAKSNLDTVISSYKTKMDPLQMRSELLKASEIVKSMKRAEANEKSIDIFIKEIEITDNKSEMQLDSLEVLGNQKKLEKIDYMSLDSLDNILDDERNDNFVKESLPFDSLDERPKTEVCSPNLMENNHTKDVSMNKNLPFLNPDKDSGKDHKPYNIFMDCAELDNELVKFKDIERKLDIINKLVEMEERKILQEKFLKECRMRPLKANFNDGKGVVKILSRNFDKLASKRNVDLTDLDSLTFDDEDATPSQADIKRNFSLPDILDGEMFDEAHEIINPEKDEFVIMSKTEMLNNQTESKPQVKLERRVYNETVIPKTDIHIDSENYESSTTSSSCANSPKRLSIWHGSGPKTNPVAHQPAVVKPKCAPRIGHVRPGLSIPSVRALQPAGASGCSSKRICLQRPTLPSKMSAIQGRHLSPYDPVLDEDSGLRRAISLSDIALKPAGSPRTPQVSSKSNTSPMKSSNLPSTRQLQRHSGKFGNSMTRSSSVGVLNQSDSESDPSSVVRPGSVQPSRSASGLMRPTISSQNKIAPGAARRRGLQTAYSSVNLSTVGQEDSSSEAESATGSTITTVTGKPAIPPRPRAVSIDHTGHNTTGRRGNIASRSGSERDLSAKAREVTMRLSSASGAVSSRNRIPENIRNDNQLSQQLCQQLAEQLTRTASKVVHLYRKLSVNPQDGNIGASGDSNTMLTGLEQAISETQKMLRAVTNSQLINSQPKSRPLNGGMMGVTDEPISLSSTSGTDGETVEGVRQSNGGKKGVTMGSAADKLEELVMKGIPNTNGNTMLMMDQYSDISDILLNMVQQNIISGNQQNQNGSEDR